MKAPPHRLKALIRADFRTALAAFGIVALSVMVPGGRFPSPMARPTGAAVREVPSLPDAFREVRRRHDRYRPELARWRRRLARHAPELARIIAGLPGGDRHSQRRLRSILRDPAGGAADADRRLFAPWSGRWRGPWANGVMQYHDWRPPRRVGKRWLQTVTIGEAGFVSAAEVADRGDLAISCWSAALGMTGWVSKRLHGVLQLPHLGYRIDDTTMVWFCTRAEGDLAMEPPRDWLVFLETVSGTGQERIYRIEGIPVRLGSRCVAIEAEAGRHSGRYAAQPERVPPNGIDHALTSTTH